MQIGTRVRYGMLAMMELARRGSAVPARALDIANAYGLSKGYLEGLLAALRRSGLVRAVRGPGGGWVLATGAARIKPLEIYAALEGPTALVPCAADAKLCPTGQSKCRARSLWVAMGTALERTLKADTLAQLAGVAPRKKKKPAPKKRAAKKTKARPKIKGRAPKSTGKRKAKPKLTRKPARAKAPKRGKILKAPSRRRLRKSA